MVHISTVIYKKSIKVAYSRCIITITVSKGATTLLYYELSRLKEIN